MERAGNQCDQGQTRSSESAAMSDPVTKMVGAVDIDDEPALHARKTGHLQIGNQTRGLSEVCGLQETPCGLEGGYIVPKRFDQVSERFSDHHKQ
jgi:hypothetical protein